MDDKAGLLFCVASLLISFDEITIFNAAGTVVKIDMCQILPS